MRQLIFLFLLCFTVEKSFSQDYNYDLHAKPEHFDSVCMKQLCKPTYLPQYYSVKAKNQKSSYQILKEWKAFYKNVEGVKLPTGYLTIRFFVNCKGEPCCFRFYELDHKYIKTSYPQQIKDQLTAFVQQLGGWKLATLEDKSPTNYYYYLTFKIQDNDFKTVAP
jgi:hypothetical protein